MGKPKKGGYPAPQPITHYIEIIDGKINPAAVTIAWGDWVAWTNKDAVSYTLVLFKNG
jgi:plastocyanin